MSSSGLSASPGVSFSPGFLGGILAPGLSTGGGTVFLASATGLPAGLPFFSSTSGLAPLIGLVVLAASVFLVSALAAGLAPLTGLAAALEASAFLAATLA